jgi:hypothetical protein
MKKKKRFNRVIIKILPDEVVKQNVAQLRMLLLLLGQLNVDKRHILRLTKIWESSQSQEALQMFNLPIDGVTKF